MSTVTCKVNWPALAPKENCVWGRGIKFQPQPQPKMIAEPIKEIPKDKAWLQFCAQRVGPEQVQVDYEMVLPLHEVDCRGKFDHRGAKKRPVSHRVVWLDSANNRHIPFGRTVVGTSNRNYPFYRHQELGELPRIDLPFRDGAHCTWDNEKLGLQIYYVTADAIYKLTPEPARA